MPTLRDLLAEAREALGAAGIGDARREALHLWSAIDGRQPGAVLLGDDMSVSDETALRFRQLVERRLGGEPLAYVTGTMDFRHLTLRSDPRALIPRPETEGLVEVALQCMERGVAADVGTGTGAIALALRQEGRFDQLFGTDLSRDALMLAAENASRTGLEVTWLEGDLLEPLAGRRLDLLVSNPPYLTEAEYRDLDASVRDFEPALALWSGADGMAAIERLVAGGMGLVAPGGWLVLEVDARRADLSARLAVQRGWLAVEVLDDLFGRPRYVRAQQRSSE